jgi:hypothetical protein
MLDVSDQWSAPVMTEAGFWNSIVEIPTGVTLAQAGDQLRFTSALVYSRQWPEQFNPAVGGEAGPVVHEEGLHFGGTCIVTAE